ncbi:hypothetical protein ABTN12_19330, partial [Acinetobacter baumannii]
DTLRGESVRCETPQKAEGGSEVAEANAIVDYSVFCVSFEKICHGFFLFDESQALARYPGVRFGGQINMFGSVG